MNVWDIRVDAGWLTRWSRDENGVTIVGLLPVFVFVLSFPGADWKRISCFLDGYLVEAKLHKWAHAGVLSRRKADVLWTERRGNGV